MYSFTEKVVETKAQATIEAALLIPVVFILLLLMIQPAIILYNHMVMQAAASEGCRLLATKTDVAGASSEKCESYILRRLGSIPSQDNFHVHGGDCSWEIQLTGNESTSQVQVSIKNKVKLLPLFDASGSLLGITDSSGVFTQEVVVEMPTQAAWVTESEFGLNPQAWIEKWSS
ncbi:MAG: TadE/TadG family type IV pilus assembly protein [Raoultibacter sp.]|jgi:hypothetical protein